MLESETGPKGKQQNSKRWNEKLNELLKVTTVGKNIGPKNRKKDENLT